MSQKWSTCVSVLKWCKCFFQHTARFLKMVTQSFLEHEIYRQLMRPTWELLQPVNSAQLTYTWPAPFFTTAYQMHPHDVALYFNCPVTNTDVLRHWWSSRAIGPEFPFNMSTCAATPTVLIVWSPGFSRLIRDAAPARLQFLLPSPCKRSAVTAVLVQTAATALKAHIPTGIVVAYYDLV